MEREFYRLCCCSFVAGVLLATGLAMTAMAQDAVGDVAALNIKASKLDPEDYVFMQPVCTRCHDASMILHSRTWSQWQDVLFQMKRYGAKGTPEQWSHITAYVGRHLTLIDVNHADEDELCAVLGIDEKTAIAMVQRRSDRRFRSATDLVSVPGLDAAVVEVMEPRLLFASVPDQP